MRRYPMLMLWLFNAALIGVLGWLWLLPSGEWRNIYWSPPEARKSDFSSMIPPLPSLSASDAGQVLSVLERPLFAATRRPPPPPPPPKAEAPVDNLSTARLTGLFEGGGSGSIILNIAGKDRRARLNDVLDGWTLKSIDARNAVFARGAETRVLQLTRAALKNYTGLPRQIVAPPESPSAPGGRTAGQPTASPSNPAATSSIGPNASQPPPLPSFSVGGGRR